MRCVHALKQWGLWRGLYIRIPRQPTRMTACCVTSVLAGITFTSTAWLSQMQLFMSTLTGYITACYGRGLAVHWILSAYHLQEHRLVTFVVAKLQLLIIVSHILNAIIA